MYIYIYIYLALQARLCFFLRLCDTPFSRFLGSAGQYTDIAMVTASAQLSLCLVLCGAFSAWASSDTANDIDEGDHCYIAPPS